MKVINTNLKIYFILCITLFSITNCKTKQIANPELKIGESTVDGKTSEALTFGMGTNGGYVIRNEKNYKTPEMVQTLPKIVRLSEMKTPKQSADETPSISVFYDGTHRLNTIKVSCKMHTDSKSCVHQSGCGWCGQLTRCIKGTQLGPLEPCVKSTYVFTSPASYATERISNTEIGGLIANISTK